MGTEAGYMFATGMGSIKFDQVLAIIEGYKEDFEKEIKLTAPSKTKSDELVAALFGGEAIVEGHFCNPFEGEIALLAEAMELVERARELTVKAITNDVEA